MQHRQQRNRSVGVGPAAARTVSSCAATTPSLTASGSIRSKKAGTVSYYWALANGQHSAADTVAFNRAWHENPSAADVQAASLARVW